VTPYMREGPTHFFLNRALLRINPALGMPIASVAVWSGSGS